MLTDRGGAYLGILHVAQHDLCVQHVRKLPHHLALDRQLLVEQRQVVLQLAVGGDQDALALGVVLRAASSSQHLRENGQGELSDGTAVETRTPAINQRQAASSQPISGP